MIKVVLQNKKPVDVVLHPKQGIQIEETKKYLFDPAVVQKYVDASAENAEASQQIYDQFVAESEEFKEEVKVISRETARDEVSGVVAEVEANVEIAKEASQSAAESAEKAEQNAAKVPDPSEENTALIYKDGVVQWGKAAAENDGVSITENAKGQIQTIGVIDNNGEATKIWNGTRAECDALEEKDSDTLYNVVDDETDDVAVSSFEIGDIGIAPLGVDETQNKRRYLNGQVILQSQFVSFTSKVKNAILQFPNLGATEENWQAEVTNSKLGQCGKFVIDDTLGTIRLPKVVNVQGLADLSLVGSIKAESLPNITAFFDTGDRGFNLSSGGAMERSATKGGYAGDVVSNGAQNHIDFNASRSSSTYQDNAPVQQEAIQYLYFIQVATGVEESVDVSREIQLNNPFFFGMSQYFESAPNNASWLLSNGAFHSGSVYVSFYQWLLRIYNGVDTVDGVYVKLHTETYDDYDYVINTADTTFRLPNRSRDDFIVNTGSSSEGIWYRVYKSGWVEQCGYVNSDVSNITNGVLVTFPKPFKDATYSLSMLSSHGDTSSNGLTVNYANLYYGAYKRDSKTATSVRICGCGRWFASGQGAEIPTSKTYYYVGETIQDANLLNASGVLTTISNLLTLSNITAMNCFQTTDSSKVGYIFSTGYGAGAVNVYAPAGGKWLILELCSNLTSSAAIYRYGDDVFRKHYVGEIVDGGTQVLAARSGYSAQVTMLKIA